MLLACVAVTVAVGALVVVALLFSKSRPDVIDVRPPPSSPSSTEASLLRDGQKLEAIKQYQARTGLSLVLAKAAIEALEKNASAPPVSEVELIRAGKKLEAIKQYKERTGVSLADAKAAVEAMTDALEPSRANDAELNAALAAGNLIDAIKRYRVLTNAGLVEAKAAVEALMGSREPVEPATAANDAELNDAVASGRLIDAIRRYRNLTGTGLVEAKAAVEALMQGRDPAREAERTNAVKAAALNDAEVNDALAAGNLIGAIKRYRELTGVGLAEAKQAVETLRDSRKS